MANARAWKYSTLTILILSLGFNPVQAEDKDGHYTKENPELHQWFDSLASGKGLCCSFVDGSTVKDVDWDVKDGKYRVRLDNDWIEVPDAALITEHNRFGMAVVWPYKDPEGHTQIRCFIPGSGA